MLCNGYTSHPDVELAESLQAAIQARCVNMEHEIISAARLQISARTFFKKNWPSELIL